MILRIVSGRVRADRIEAVHASYATAYVPIAMRAPGLARFLVAVRGDGDDRKLAALTLWSTVEAALAAYAGDLSAVRTLDAGDHGEELTHVDYYEVDESVIRHPAHEPALLRLTAGTVARGLDADIQQELRRHLPELPAEVAESYVGRRVIGDVVEIAFVSTWSAEPAGRSLAEPLWPAIASRYDTFRVEVFRVLLAGTPG